MQKRQLGQTGILVSALGLGTVKWGRNEGVKYPHPFSLPTDDEIALLLSSAKDLGINLLDTAPAYGESEKRLGQCLKGQRHDWVLCTKAGEEFVAGQSHFDFASAALIKSVERSLKRLETDYLDIVLIHSNGEDELLIQQYAVLDTLQRLKEKGHIRAIGMSTKTVKGGLLALEQADLVMMTLRPDYLDEVSVVLHAQELNKGVFIKKALGSGHLCQGDVKAVVKEILKFNLAYPAVASIVIGTRSPQHLAANALALTN